MTSIRTKTGLAALFTTALLYSPAVTAESFLQQLKDDDGWLDVSDWVLENASGFLPVPLAITEPAVGAGIGVAALFFHAPENYDASDYALEEGAEPQFVVPDISAIAAAVTENGTWVVAGGHSAHWRDDTIRYEGFLGYASVNAKFYGLEGSTSYDSGLKFSGNAYFLEQPISFRLGGSDFFLGAGWEYQDIETRFDLQTGIPEIDELTLNTRLSSLMLFLEYDALDNSFTPNKGLQFEVGYSSRFEAIGSDFEFDRLEARVHGFVPVGETLVVGARLDVDTVDGEVPFFSVPFIQLRGVPALRYQGEAVAVAEIEARWAMHPRISAVGFVGAGRAAESWSKLGDADTRASRGLGLRYFIARKLGMHMGFDVAKGPEDTHYYLTFGSAWDT